MSQSPVLSPKPIEAWEPLLANIIDDMQGAPLNIHALMAHNPELLSAWWKLRKYLVSGGTLERRHAELCILRVASRLGSWYEWASHVVRALDIGITEAEISRVRVGPQAPGWSAEERLLLQAVDELHQGHAITADTLAQLNTCFSPQQLLDLIALQGMYLTLGAIIRTFNLKLDPQVAERLPPTEREEAFPPV